MPLFSVIREAAEEAYLHPHYVSKYPLWGTFHFLIVPPSKWLPPGLYYTSPDNLEDGEVNRFELLSALEWLEKLVAREFKPFALAMVDFLHRHGAYTLQNDTMHGTVLRALKGERSLTGSKVVKLVCKGGLAAIDIARIKNAVAVHRQKPSHYYGVPYPHRLHS